MAEPAKRHAPATARNRDPITELLREILPDAGRILEIASGSGEHAVHFAQVFPDLDWQPSDPDPACRASIAAWAQEAALDNLLAPIDLDAARENWPIDRADAMICINMTHISPWSATAGLLAGAQRVLPPGAPLYLYGPFREPGRLFAASNAAFDRSLRKRDPEWGVRNLDDVRADAEKRG
ncbi:MAG: class I SAM-dependent methyltransferase, partial [Sphingomonadales bacterium]|nr:class I SAM-dependent methyltransferase [Sphingomonadales bacterium]